MTARLGKRVIDSTDAGLGGAGTGAGARAGILLLIVVALRGFRRILLGIRALAGGRPLLARVLLVGRMVRQCMPERLDPPLVLVRVGVIIRGTIKPQKLAGLEWKDMCGRKMRENLPRWNVHDPFRRLVTHLLGEHLTQDPLVRREVLRHADAVFHLHVSSASPSV